MNLRSVRSSRENFWLILLLGALSTVTPFSIDLYLPAFPNIAEALHTSIASVALSVSTYFLGFSLGQIFYGPLLDRFGRKPPLYFGLLAYLVSSFACAQSTSIKELMILRFIQALGGSAASVASTAMVRDFFPAEKGAQVFSLMMLILGVSPLLAPSIGGLIVEAWGWRAVFYSLAGIVLLILISVFFFLPEGHPADRNVSLHPHAIFSDFVSILRNRAFLTYTLAGSFSFAGLFVYVAGSPSIFMDGFHVSPRIYGAIFAVLAVGMIGGGQINVILAKRFETRAIFQAALALQVVVGNLFLVGAWSGWYGLYSTISFLFLLLACSGVTYPNAAAIALLPFSENAGRASALLGFLQLGLGSLISSGVGLFEYKGSLPTALVMAVSSVLGILILFFNQIFKGETA